VKLRKGTGEANAKSVVAIMGLEVDHGDAVQVVAIGPDAQAAVGTLTALLREGLGEEGDATGPSRRAAGPSASEPVAPPDVVAPETPDVRADHDLLAGVAASPGIAVGTAFQVRRGEIAVPERGGGAREEQRRLEHAIEQAKSQVEALQQRLAAEADPGKAAIFGAHRELLEDPALVEAAAAATSAGKSAAWAWRAAVDEHAARLGRSKNELLAARANDLRDVGHRVLRLVLGAPAEQIDPPAQSILFAEDLTPSDTASLDRTKVLGFCTTGGGATSHVAILARSLDLPAVAGIDPRALEVPDDTPVVIDGGRGTVRLNPDPAEMARIRDTLARRAARRAVELTAAPQPATTRDGHRLEVAGNVGGLADAGQVPALGGDGVGLLRSEFLFLDRANAPGEDEQAESYAAIARALGGRPLVIRTLDVGGDKPLPYLPMPAEENPFLGERAVRLMLNRPDLLRTQVRAILRAAAAGPVRIMVPMIATLTEWRAVKRVIEAERARLGAAAVPAGIMVEVPATAILADAFAREVDFFSIGTNDLTQYTLAMDRGHPKLAPQVDGLHPAVLRLIAMTVEGAHAHGKWVGVCGGIGADPQAIPLLVGLGVDELSVSVPSIPAVKAQVRTLSREACAALASRALAMDHAADVRALVPVED
jgi:phosphocarrier protein FPr